MAGLKIEHLTKSFGNTVVLDDIAFDVAEGEFCVLLGPSGCGKSTILRLIAGLESQDRGTITIGGKEVSGLSPKERDIAMVFQSYALYPHMSVYDNMAFSLKLKKTSRQETEQKVREAAGILEIEDLLGRKPKDLSGGQRQRVAIGRAIVRAPRLFLFDEPLSNLDTKLRNAMRIELIGLHRKLNSTIVYVTHDQTEAMTLGHKIVLLQEGKIRQTGTPADIYDRPANLFAASFIGSPQMNLLEGVVRENGEELLFRSGGIILDITALRHMRDYIGKTVTAGIRPEALVPGTGPLRGRIELLEHLGSETIVHARIGERNIVARLSPDFPHTGGEEISFDLNWKGVHFFSRGERI